MATGDGTPEPETTGAPKSRTNLILWVVLAPIILCLVIILGSILAIGVITVFGNQIRDRFNTSTRELEQDDGATLDTDEATHTEAGTMSDGSIGQGAGDKAERSLEGSATDGKPKRRDER